MEILDIIKKVLLKENLDINLEVNRTLSVEVVEKIYDEVWNKIYDEINDKEVKEIKTFSDDLNKILDKYRKELPDYFLTEISNIIFTYTD